LHHRLSTHPTLIRADFADNEQIEELLAWTHPHLESSSTTPSPNAVIFTEAENLAMLRLPRKECKYTITVFLSTMVTTQECPYCRPRLTSRNPQPLPNAPNAPLRLRLRCPHNAARSNSRKRMDDRNAHNTLHRARPSSIFSFSSSFPTSNNKQGRLKALGF
jgi:hypothetical protein